MKRKSLIIGALLMLLSSYTVVQAKDKQTKEKPNFKIAHHTIISKFKANANASLDIKELKKQYKKYPERWEAAFKFLSETDISTLKYGRYDLSDDVYVNYAEGKTKDLKDCKYEKHEKWIDLQYMVEGEEYMGKNKDIKGLKVLQPYNEKKDVALFEYDGKEMMLATPKEYFIFFPSDAHIPTVKVGEIRETKKLVIKIKYN